MKRIFRVTLLTLVGCLASLASAQDVQPIDIGPYVAAGRIQGFFASYKYGVTGLKITFRSAAYPTLSLLEVTNNLDYRNWDALQFDIQNLEGRNVKLFLRLDDTTNADGITHCKTAWHTVKKGETVTVSYPLRVVPMDQGMRTYPPIGNSFWMPDNKLPLNLQTIFAHRFYIENPAINTSLIIKNMRLVRVPSLLQGFHDEFGQFNRVNWPGKVHNLSELVQNDVNEEKALSEELQNGPNIDFDGMSRDEYGGWADGPQLAATGRFRTVFLEGKWWFVDPIGNLFFSYGMDSLDYFDIATVTTQREYMYSWLPQPTGYLGNHYAPIVGVFAGPVREGLCYNFYSANCERKYGAEFQDRNFSRTLDRMHVWGFNTVGAFSNECFWVHRHRIPYNAFVRIGGTHRKIQTQPGYYLHDPFDPQFVTDCGNSLQSIAPTVADDPYNVGWFIDNELLWSGGTEENGRYGIAYGTLNETMASPSKQAFMSDLRTRYTTITALNSAWGTNFSSWTSLEAPNNLAQSSTAARKVDFQNFIRRFALQYFTTVRACLNTKDPQALYLGPRFFLQTKEVTEASAQVCDVLTFNIYRPVLPGQYFYPDIAYLNKPFMVGEFHFGALDRGMFNPSLAPTFDQNDRARSYTNYVKSVLENKAFIGCHWFQYVDQPLAGRMYDGENYANGFVSVADVPYTELVESAKQIHALGYAYRYSLP